MVLIATSFTLSASAWGPKGHDVVACVAENNLSKRALKRIEAVLNGKSMVYVANWLDNASHTPEYAYTKTWHYVNVEPSEGSYAESQREPKGDVVTAVNSIVERLKSGELTKEEERAELMMLIHLVGDMHCPEHRRENNRDCQSSSEYPADNPAYRWEHPHPLRLRWWQPKRPLHPGQKRP